MFMLWSFMKMKLEILFAFTVSTNLREKTHMWSLLQSFSNEYKCMFCFQCYSQQNINCKGIFPQDLNFNLFIETWF